MRISDWSSDVCSSDLSPRRPERSAQHPCRNLPPRIDQQRDRDDPDERGEDRREIAEHPLQVAPVQAKLIEAADSEAKQRDRSEEHTSELQSLMRISYAVFCLKKKKKTHKT